MKMKRIRKILLLFILLIPFRIMAMSIPQHYSKNVIIYDISEDEILYEENASDVVSIASLTKIMTTIVAIENIDDLDQTITITRQMLDEVPFDASVAKLKENDVVTYRDLLYASMLPSGADATTALGYGISGSTAEFVKLMNQKSAELGLTNTHFVNVTGYDADNHYSTPEEVLKFLLYALNNSLFKQIYMTKEYTLTNGLHVESTINLYNKLGLVDLSFIKGSKTGFTDNAGLCMSSIVDVNDNELLLLTLNAPRINGTSYNLEDTINIRNYLNDNFKDEYIYQKDQTLFKIPVVNSNITSYDVKVGSDIKVYTDNLENEEYHYEYEGLKELSYKNQKNDKIGVITYYYKDKEVKEDVYLTVDIKPSLFNYLKEHINYVIPISLISILLVVIVIRRIKLV